VPFVQLSGEVLLADREDRNVSQVAVGQLLGKDLQKRRYIWLSRNLVELVGIEDDPVGKRTSVRRRRLQDVNESGRYRAFLLLVAPNPDPSDEEADFGFIYVDSGRHGCLALQPG
jgi:hypothetical protein